MNTPTKARQMLMPCGLLKGETLSLGYDKRYKWFLHWPDNPYYDESTIYIVMKGFKTKKQAQKIAKENDWKIKGES